MRILVVKLSSLGDIVLATPSVQALRARWPEAEITVAVNQEFVPLIRACPDVDAVLVRERSTPTRRLKTLLQASWAGWLRAGRFDLAIDLQGNFHSAAWTSLVRARRRAGLGQERRGWEFCIPPSHDRHAVDLCGAVVERLSAPLVNRQPRLKIPAADERVVADVLRARRLPTGGFVVVHPCTCWQTKEWPLDRYAALLGRLLGDPRTPQSILITGSAAEARHASVLEGLVASPRVRSVAGCLPLEGFLALWSRAAIFIGGDTGPMHVSAALGVPVVALFGPTLPEVSGPIGASHRVIQASRPDTHSAYRTLAGQNHMLALGVDQVFRTVTEMLDAVAGRLSA